jgi:hypothetical protein
MPAIATRQMFLSNQSALYLEFLSRWRVGQQSSFSQQATHFWLPCVTQHCSSQHNFFCLDGLLHSAAPTQAHAGFLGALIPALERTYEKELLM